MRKIYFLFLFLIYASIIDAQTIKVNPYLQDANPNSITISWETDSGEESQVEWGLTESLGNISTGNSEISNGESRIHEVVVNGLSKFTKYYYRVKTGVAVSEIYSFKTPPFASDHEPVRIIAMSDMQQDGAFPGKFSEIIHEGILTFLAGQGGGEVIDNLALVMIPGDLVQDGNNYNSWKNTFFDPASDLFSRVPVYPVLGNHESNSIYFFKYFKLPANGTVGYEEHWWYKDYGNVRILGLDSNAPFTNQAQLDWLDNVLASACDADSIDFVFAQMHHPYKSELWTPGELDYTGEVIERMEQFSTNCNKPSIHFFGHTHGYSRGNSRDHKHLWINVATAGGAIDNWGEFPNFDYDEFSISEDEYGFVSVEVTDDDDPSITIKRISRGDQNGSKDNPITDSLTIRLNANVVNTPTTIFPVNETVIPVCVTLKASGFSSPSGNSVHGQSHWQVSTLPDFNNLAAESWKNYENWYNEVNTQAGDDLTDEKIIGLDENTSYWWRVRYRDRELNWGNWTAPVAFATGESPSSQNLLLNGGSEDSLLYWTIAEGVVESLPDTICAGTSPHSGLRYFAVGGLCEHSPVGRCYQDIDMLPFTDSIMTGNYNVTFGGYLSDYAGSDLPEMKLYFLDTDENKIDSSSTLSTLNTTWTLLSENLKIPLNTSSIRFELKGTRNAGTDNDCYFDDLFLKVGNSITDCSGTSSVINQPVISVPDLKVTPNPVSSTAIILLPGSYKSLQILISDQMGEKVYVPMEISSDKIILNTEYLISGSYYFWIKENNKQVGKGKFVVIK